MLIQDTFHVDSMSEAAVDLGHMQIFVKMSSISEIAPNCAMDLQNKSNVKALG